MSVDARATVHAVVNPAMARELAVAEGVCVRPQLRSVRDRRTGAEEIVAIPCGSTRESRCPACAKKAQRLRMQQCAEGWHRTDEPEPLDPPSHESDNAQDTQGEDTADLPSRRVRSTRRREDVPDLPRVAMADRTVGVTFCGPDGRVYRPSMFVTLTLPSYGKVHQGVPTDPDGYRYRRAALDAVLFPRLVDQFFKNLRRCAGFDVQYFSVVEPQKRGAPHLHAALRGAIPRAILRQVVAATYVQVWWPPFHTPVYDERDRPPVWDGTDYVDATTGTVLPSWRQALDDLGNDPDARPVHVVRFGKQLDIRGIIAPSPDADRAIRYLVKYLTKSVTEPFTNPECVDYAYEAHVDRLQEELRFLPCSEQCANWLRYGLQPKDAGPGLVPGRCWKKAHDRECLGLGGRRVLVSRKWSGKTLSRHKADRALVVRQVLEEAGLTLPEIDRLAADVRTEEGQARFEWTKLEHRPSAYVGVILRSVAERRRWRADYEHAKTLAQAKSGADARKDTVAVEGGVTAMPP